MSILPVHKEERNVGFNFTGTGFVFARRFRNDFPVSVDLHLHEWHEFVWCHSFNKKPLDIQLVIDDQSFRIQEPSLIYSPPFHAHKVHYQTPHELFVIGIDSSMSLKSLKDSVLSYPLERVYQGWRSLPSVMNIDNNNLFQDCSHGTLASLDAIHFIVTLNRMLEPWISRRAKDHDQSDEIVRSAMIYLEKNFASPVDVEKCSSSIGVSRSALSHRFKMATGLSIPQWLMDVRLRHARLLLLETDKEIIDIALECGFNNASWFSQAFRKSMGISPSQWRSEKKSITAT